MLLKHKKFTFRPMTYVEETTPSVKWVFFLIIIKHVNYISYWLVP